MLTLPEVLNQEVDATAVEAGIGLQDLGSVSVVTLARPEQLNALTLASWTRIRDIFRELAEVPRLRSVVVRGAGDRAFGAGADIGEFPDVRLTAADALVYNETIATALRTVRDLPVPVIAAIGGLAVGGGCELAAACDVRLATTSARFGIPIGRLGVTLGLAEAEAVARLIGPGTLKYLLFSGGLIDAQRALQIGLVQQVVEPEALTAETVRLVETVLASSEITMRAAKLVADMCGRTLDPADTENLTRISVEAYDGDDLKEGVAAFVAGRPPEFTASRGGA